MVIASSANQKIKFLRSLITHKKARKDNKKFIVEGATLFRETPSSLIEEVYCREGDFELLSMAVAKCSAVYEVSAAVFDSLSDTVSPSGILAIVRERQPNCSLGNKVLLLDGVSDPGNVGTLIRTAAGFKLDAVLLVDSAEAYSPKVVRSAMGGIFKLDVITTDRASALDMIKGRTLYALDMDGTNIKTLIKPRSYVIAVGNEAHGISPEIREQADYITSIVAPGIESLNAAVAGSIAMFQFS